MTRRFFLSQAGAAALAAQSPNDQVSMAVIGVGGRGSGLTKQLVKSPKARVVALCDINQEKMERNGAVVKRETGKTPVLESDFRRVLDMKDVDAVALATPHHWHAVIAVRAMQAGKDVYVEKPASHVFREGRLLVEAAKKYNRIAQHGTQMRSSDTIKEAQKVIDSGILGAIKMAKAWNCQKRSHPQPASNSSVPPGVDYDMWLGPAPKIPFNENRFEYNWHFYPEYGNGDIGGDGIHDIDLARWGLGVKVHPNRITAHGSRIALEGERQFPDNMMVAYQYDDDDKVLIYEDRIWTPYGQHGVDSGDAVYGTEGYMLISRRGWFRTYIGKDEEEGPAMKGNGGWPQHLENFLECVRTRKQPNAPMEVAHLSCGLVHLGNIAYRVGRILHFDPKREIFPDDAEATARLTKEYREPWSIPDPV